MSTKPESNLAGSGRCHKGHFIEVLLDVIGPSKTGPGAGAIITEQTYRTGDWLGVVSFESYNRNSSLALALDLISSGRARWESMHTSDNSVCSMESETCTLTTYTTSLLQLHGAIHVQHGTRWT